MKKILCVSDHIDPLVYSSRVKDRFGDVDLVVSAGDLPMDYLGFIASSLNKPVAFVFGNHNLEKMHLFRREFRSEPIGYRAFHHGISDHHYGSTYVGWKSVLISNVLIAGLGGSMRYNSGDNQYTERQMRRRIYRLIPRLIYNRIRYGRYLDVLVTHAPPRGIHDRTDPCHLGFRSFIWFMKVFQPRYLLHGHIHLYDQNALRITRYMNTDVINVYDHYVLEMEEIS